MIRIARQAFAGRQRDGWIGCAECDRRLVYTEARARACRRLLPSCAILCIDDRARRKLGMIVHTAERHADYYRICCLPIPFLASLRVERGYVAVKIVDEERLGKRSSRTGEGWSRCDCTLLS
jgi:hypothetical protein